MIMDLLQIKIEKAKALLPEETRQSIDNVDWRQAILDIKTKKGFNLDQLENLEIETELLLCGLLDPKEYPKQLQSKLGITDNEAQELVNDMNEHAFKKIRDEFMKITDKQNTELLKHRAEIAKEIPVEKIPIKIVTPDQTQTKEDTSILKTAGIEITPASFKKEVASDISEKRDDMIKDLEQPELINKQEVKTKIGIETINKILPTISNSKLSGSFQIPTAKTEYSLGNMTKNTEIKELTPNKNLAEMEISTPKENTITRPKIPGVDPYLMPIDDEK
ncbi:MAG: hypothetical protein NTZ44_01185 [Candidatus Nomurabacteria bacterium]|nr:hypothetical protein [Candidatus Nomurabacteria bacterium]